MSKKKRGFIRGLKGLFAFILLVVIGGSILICVRRHGDVSVEGTVFQESSRVLKNPYRGFYRVYGFTPYDHDAGYYNEVIERLSIDQDTTLAMIQISLRKYTNSPITKEGMEHLHEIFEALETVDKTYIVRFVYDWDGKNQETEPESVDIILGHMYQLEEIFREYNDLIFVHQGIFIGNWGEMNGTRYLEYMVDLARQLESVTEESTFLAVRTPAQWRKVTDIGAVNVESLQQEPVAARWSLFNDGIMGNEGDYGTYGTQSKTEAGRYGYWNRQEELAFQEVLCQVVPNGGEVIVDNPLNDFENAIRDLATMHVTYLNQGYDKNVMNKWAETIVTEDGCFHGMDGLSYVERHLGYRLFIADTDLEYDFWKDQATVSVTLQNVGFAPMYKQPKVYLVLRNENGKTEIRYELEQDVRVLVGGNEWEEQLTLKESIGLVGVEPGAYQLYFYMEDPGTEKHIQLANEQDEDVYGYYIGSLQLGTIEEMLGIGEK